MHIDQATGKKVRIHTGYEVRFSTRTDATAIGNLIAGGKVKNASKRNAVYERKKNVIRAVSNKGFVSTVWHNDTSGDKTLVGTTAVFTLGMDENHDQHKLHVQKRSKPGQEIYAAEIGGTRLVLDNVPPNEDGALPKGCFYNLMVCMSVMQAFHAASEEVAYKRLQADILVATVQTHDGMGYVRRRLGKEPLDFDEIVPHDDLREKIGGTTANKDGFEARDKTYYMFPVTSLPNVAKYLLECFAEDAQGFGSVQNDNGQYIDVVKVKFDIDQDFRAKLEAIVARRDQFRQLHEDATITNAAEILKQPIDIVASASRNRVLQNGRPSSGQAAVA